MRLFKILFACLFFGITSMLDGLLKNRMKVACADVDDVPSDVVFAMTLLKFGRFFLIVAIILFILFT